MKMASVLFRSNWVKIVGSIGLVILGAGIGVFTMMLVPYINAVPWAISIFGALVAAMVVVALLRTGVALRKSIKTGSSEEGKKVMSLLQEGPGDKKWSEHISHVISISWKDIIAWIKEIGVIFVLSFFLVQFVILSIQVVSVFVSVAEIQATTKQSEVLMLIQNSQNEFERANEAFLSIERVLMDSDASVDAQLNAVRRVPYVMGMMVTQQRFDSHKNEYETIRVTFPNADRIKELLRIYITAKRQGSGEFVDDFEFDQIYDEDADATKRINEISDLSTEILHTLHCLGPVSESDLENCLWNLDSNRDYKGLAVPESRKTLSVFAPSHVLDLRHIGYDFLYEAELPFACLRTRWSILFKLPEGDRGMNLRGMNIYGGYFRCGDIRTSIIDNANFSYCRILDADISGSRIHKVNFKNAKLSAVKFNSADFFRSRFFEASVEECSFRSSLFTRCFFQGAFVNRSNFYGSVLSGVTAQAASVKGNWFNECIFEDCVLEGVDFEGGSFLEAEFKRCKSGGARFIGARMIGVTFSDGCDLSGARFQKADLCGARFQGVKLPGVDFQGAKVEGRKVRIFGYWEEGEQWRYYIGSEGGDDVYIESKYGVDVEKDVREVDVPSMSLFGVVDGEMNELRFKRDVGGKEIYRKSQNITTPVEEEQLFRRLSWFKYVDSGAGIKRLQWEEGSAKRLESKDFKYVVDGGLLRTKISDKAFYLPLVIGGVGNVLPVTIVGIRSDILVFASYGVSITGADKEFSIRPEGRN